MRRNAFTLVELLVVITILAMLASLVLFALASVQETSREMKTRATIEKLNALIMQKWETYRTRRIPVNVGAVAAYYQTLNGSDKRQILPSAKPGLANAAARLAVLRDIMRLEMPDGFLDIKDPPATQWRDGASVQTMQRPNASSAYLRALPANTSQSTNVSAKCLYLIVTKGLGEPDVLEQFAENEIETDQQDGMKYFKDGWGNPIYFLRWAPAFRSPLQSGPPATGHAHDPFDPVGASEIAISPAQETFPLFPLIYSAGPDKAFGITADANGSPIHFKDYNNSPFHADIINFVGKPDGDTSIDNITNHVGG